MLDKDSLVPIAIGDISIVTGTQSGFSTISTQRAESNESFTPVVFALGESHLNGQKIATTPSQENRRKVQETWRVHLVVLRHGKTPPYCIVTAATQQCLCPR